MKPGLVRLPHAQPHDVRLFCPEAGFPRWRHRLPSKPPAPSAAAERRRAVPAVLPPLPACGCSTRGWGSRRRSERPTSPSLLGKVPFLNGGLFDVHELERENPGNSAFPDEAFERVFDFFDGYRWHLRRTTLPGGQRDQSQTSSATSSRSMSTRNRWAHTTRKRTSPAISPATRSSPSSSTLRRGSVPVAFRPGRRRLASAGSDDPDRYIYPAARPRHSLERPEARGPQAPLDIPLRAARQTSPAGVSTTCPSVAAGTPPPPEEYALPTETWREVVSLAVSGYEEVRTKACLPGECTEVTELITLNLDIERFALAVIAQSEGPELLRAFWHAIYGNRERSDTGISVSSTPPAALAPSSLPLSTSSSPSTPLAWRECEGFLDDAERSERRRSPKYLEGLSPHPGASV